MAGERRIIGARALAPWLVVVLAVGALPACTRAAASGKPWTKVSGDLLALHAAYEEARQRGVEFQPGNPLLRIVDDRVAIDATATGDVAALQADLVGLGLRHAAHAGPMVSGELPIASIPALDALPRLGFARASVVVNRRPPPRPRRGRVARLPWRTASTPEHGGIP